MQTFVVHLDIDVDLPHTCLWNYLVIAKSTHYCSDDALFLWLLDLNVHFSRLEMLSYFLNLS